MGGSENKNLLLFGPSALLLRYMPSQVCWGSFWMRQRLPHGTEALYARGRGHYCHLKKEGERELKAWLMGNEIIQRFTGGGCLYCIA